jgi:hypothetical protein
MDDRFERKGAMASQIPKSVRWSYDANFKLMVIKRVEETNNCALHGNSVPRNRMYDAGENKKNY